MRGVRRRRGPRDRRSIVGGDACGSLVRTGRVPLVLRRAPGTAAIIVVVISRRAFQEPGRDEPEGERRPDEHRRLAARQPLRVVHQLADVFLAKPLREAVDLIGGLLDVLGDGLVLLIAELSGTLTHGGYDAADPIRRAILLRAELSDGAVANAIGDAALLRG